MNDLSQRAPRQQQEESLELRMDAIKVRIWKLGTPRPQADDRTLRGSCRVIVLPKGTLIAFRFEPPFYAKQEQLLPQGKSICNDFFTLFTYKNLRLEQTR